MRRFAWLIVIAGCGKILGIGDFRGAPSDSGGPGNDAAQGSDAAPGSDASTADASTGSLTITASPSTFVLHANDTRDTLLTITNPTTVSSGAVTLAASDLTLGTMTFSMSTCTAGIGPGHSCTAVGELTATSAGQITFQVGAIASSVGSALTSLLPLTVMAACPANCGPDGTANCCASSMVPGNAVGATLAGAPFYRSYDLGGDGAFPLVGSNAATVSDFRLDTYIVTVGRFRAFVTAGMGTASTAPSAGAGAHAKIADSGWDTSWNSSLVADTATLIADVKCDPTYQTWTDTAGANEALPMSCITWYEAMAFCIWDGGYLPTEAEWNYAASGGSDQRAYPWSSPAGSLAIDTATPCTYANFDVNNPSGTHCVNGTTGATNRVGSESPKGDGKWGQSDLGGNILEWNLDWYAGSYPMPCNDCANLTAASYRVLRGGTFYFMASDLRTGYRDGDTPADRDNSFGGMRCARTP